MANTNSSLLGLSGHYQVAPESEWSTLLDDAGIVLDSVVAQIDSLACELAEDGEEMTSASIASYLFGTLQLAEMAKNIASEGHIRALKEIKELSPGEVESA